MAEKDTGTPAGRGRGRGRGKIAVQAVGTPGPSNRQLGSSTTPATPSTGLLGNSDYARLPAASGSNGSAAASGSGTKTKFAPNPKRKGRLPDVQTQVKMEDGMSESKPRPARGAGRGRAEVIMTASGPMGQGPQGSSKSYSARSSAPEGQGVMSRSTSNSFGGGASVSADQFVDADESDFETPSQASSGADSDEENTGRRDRVFKAKDMAAIGEREEMAPITLLRDPKEVRESKERKRERSERIIKGEAKPEDEIDDKSTLASATATPAPDYDMDSKTGSVDSKALLHAAGDTDRKIDFKAEDELEDLSADFDVDNPSEEKLYIFQFPRKFPELITALETPAPSSPTSSTDSNKPTKTAKGKPSASDLESGGEDEKPALEKRKKIPPVWGKSGSRGAKGARWSREQGAVGELVIRKSGRVTLVVNGDMEFEVLPAAQPSFLQEVVILDHDPSTIPRPLGTPSHPYPPTAASSHNRSILTMGQTGKKFIVVPEVGHLLEKIEKQEKEEKEEKERLKKFAGAKKEEI